MGVVLVLVVDEDGGVGRRRVMKPVWAKVRASIRLPSSRHSCARPRPILATNVLGVSERVVSYHVTALLLARPSLLTD